VREGEGCLGVANATVIFNVGFLSREEMVAVIGQPGDTWTSQRDHLLLVMLYNTGARASEIIGLR
jgi:site-specific recombinase XerD